MKWWKLNIYIKEVKQKTKQKQKNEKRELKDTNQMWTCNTCHVLRDGPINGKENAKDPVYGSVLYYPFSSLLHSDNMLMQTIATEVKNIFWGLAKCLMYNPGQVRDRNCLSPFNVSGVPKMHRRVLGMHGSRSPLQVPHVRTAKYQLEISNSLKGHFPCLRKEYSKLDVEGALRCTRQLTLRLPDSPHIAHTLR